MSRIVPAPIIGQSAASGAQVIDGSLNFEGGKNQALKRTPTSVGNRKIWTWSCWLKKQNNNRSTFFSAGTTSSDTGFSEIAIGTQKRLRFSGWNTNWKTGSERLRDYNNFYHFVIAVDYTNSTASNKVRLYKNGVEVTDLNINNTPSDADRAINDTVIHYIGGIDGGGGENLTFTDYRMSQVYFIDGQQLGPEYFGFTDPLTGTWRPKKFDISKTPSGSWGTNGFYLPMDGNSPIGQDKSGIVTPNNGSIWSDSLTVSSGFRSSEPKTNAFDGNTSSICSAVGSGTITFTSPVTFASNSTIRVFLHGGDHTVTVNGGSNQTISAGSFQTVTYSNSGNANFVMTFHRGGGADTGVRAIEINNHILVDGQIGNNWTPVNFGGSAGIDQATGALPILNTTQGGTQAGVGVFGSKENKYYTTTSATNSAGHYVFENEGAQPTLSFIRGATYTFDYSASTGHPLRFATAADAAGSTEYTDGTSVSGNVISFTVPHNAPNTLYYYCTNHGGMGNSISVTTDETKADQYASNCVLALPLVGTKNDVSNQINSGSTATSLVDYGDPAASSIKSNFYGGSFYYDGNDGHDLGVINDTDLEMGSSDFCIEGWFNANTTLDSTYWNPILTLPWHGQNNSESQIFIGFAGGASSPYSAGEFHARIRDSSSIKELPTGLTTLYNDQTWHHFALTKNGTTAALFVDGVLKITVTTEASLNTGLDDQKGYIATYNNNTGNIGSPQGFYKGYISDLRIYKGVAKYTSDFVPASTNPDILPDTPSGVSGGSKLTKITDGAVSFDGTGDYLQVSNSNDFDLGSGDFTWECFAYVNDLDTGTPQWFFSVFSTSSGDNAWGLRLEGDGRLYAYLSSDGSESPVTIGPTLANSGMGDKRWHHLAVVRSGSSSNNITVYVDGISRATGTFNGTVNDTSLPLQVGRQGSGSYTQYLNGFVSNLRVIKGTALYTSNFTPPSAPLTNVTNTKLLCCQSNTSANLAAVSPATFSNDGTVWSSSSTISSGSNAANKSLTNGFDGSISTAFEGDTSGATVTVPVSATISAGGVRVYAAVTSGNPLVVLLKNGGTTVETINTGSSGGKWYASSSYSGAITSLVISRTGRAPEFNAIEINGCVLVDGISGEAIQRAGDAAATNFNPFNTDINTVRGQETSYPTFNPLDKHASNTLSNGNLTSTASATAAVRATNPFPTTGKWYVEYTMDAVTTNGYPVIGISGSDVDLGAYSTSGIIAVRPVGSSKNLGWVIEGTDTPSNYMWTGFAASDGDTIQIAFNVDDQGLYIGVNNNWWGVSGSNAVRVSNADMLTGTNSALRENPNKEYFPWSMPYTNAEVSINFGQKPFKFPPPDGFQPMNGTNILLETAIPRPDQYVGVTTYSGNSSSSNFVTDLNFNSKPDFVWIKARSGSSSPGSQNHYLVDSVRGANGSVTKKLYSNSTGEENAGQNDANNGVRFVLNGFELTSSNDGTNANNAYVAWAWKAGGSKGTFNVDDVGYANASDVNMNVGTFDNVTFDKSQNWTSQVSGSQNGSYPFSNMFNADGEATHAYPANGTRATFTPSPSFSNAKTVKVWYYGPTINDNTFQLNGVNVGNQMIATSSTKTKTFSVNGFTSWSWSKGIGGDDSGMLRIDVDGVQLVDSGVSTPSVPSVANTGCSVGTKQGFSITKFTTGSGTSGGATIAHGLNSKPDMYMYKPISTSGEWVVIHEANYKRFAYLNATTNFRTIGSQGGGTAAEPTDNVLTLYDLGVTLASKEYICYSWSNIPGLQKFGRYEGTGVAGNYVNLGFRPALLWIKSFDSTSIENWGIIDSTRSYANPGNHTLATNLTNAESYFGDGSSVYGSSNKIDLVSDGFVLRETSGFGNTSGITFIYCAWAEAPQFNLYGGQSNAR